MSNKAMWFHHLSIVWNVVSTVLTVGFVLLWFWYGLTFRIGNEKDGIFEHHSNGLRDHFAKLDSIRSTSQEASRRIAEIKIRYNDLFDQLSQEVRAKIKAGTLTPEESQHYQEEAYRLEYNLRQELDQVIKEACPSESTQAG